MKPPSDYLNSLFKFFKKRSVTPGEQAEIDAEKFLKKQGCKILARNFLCKGGELDIIALHKGVIIFVEVRLRTNLKFGGAAQSISQTKQRRLKLAAQVWLQSTNGQNFINTPKRFDAILFEHLDQPPIWLRNIF